MKAKGGQCYSAVAGAGIPEVVPQEEGGCLSVCDDARVI